MTRYPIRHVLSIVPCLALAACAASTAPPSKPVARYTAAAPGQVVHVQVPPSARYVVEGAANTTYVLRIQPDERALRTTRAELEQRQAALAARDQQLRSERQAREQAERERDAALTRAREIDTLGESDRALMISLTGTVMFRHDDATLLPEARARLDRVADALKLMDPNRRIVIEGHTDALGTDEYNRRLSEARASAVRSYLLQRGISPDRVIAVGRGKQQPFATNQTAEGRANNRRAEIVISSSGTAGAG
jgi:outer membrane protein OmpA-like peptidoglycan-associated protein